MAELLRLSRSGRYERRGRAQAFIKDAGKLLPDVEHDRLMRCMGQFVRECGV